MNEEKTPLSDQITPRVLIAAPTSIVKNYCINNWINFTDKITFPNAERMLVDNTKHRAYSVTLNKRMGNCKWVDPKIGSSHVYITACQNKIREHAIKNNFTHILMLEADVTPPAYDIIERLLYHNKQIVGGTYYIREGGASHLMIQKWIGYGQELSLVSLDNGADTMFIDGKLKQVASIGLGCTLIARSVFEKMPFRFQVGAPNHSDTYFSIDAYMNRIPVWCDTSIVCEHNNQNWANHSDTKIKVK